MVQPDEKVKKARFVFPEPPFRLIGELTVPFTTPEKHKGNNK